MLRLPGEFFGRFQVFMLGAGLLICFDVSCIFIAPLEKYRNFNIAIVRKDLAIKASSIKSDVY